MSEIPLHKRKKSSLDVQHNIYKIRREITLNLMETFGYSKQKFERHVKKAVAFIQNDEDRKAREDQLRQREEGFDLMFIEHERVRILDMVCEIRETLINSTLPVQADNHILYNRSIKNTGAVLHESIII